MFTICTQIVDMSAVVSVRIPARLKREMEKLKHVDWAELVKATLQDRVAREEARRLWADIEKLRGNIPTSPKADFSTRSIREDRGR